MRRPEARLWNLLLALACLPAALPAQAPPSQAQLVAEHTSIQPGQPFYTGLRITLAPGWHSYWKNPGDSGSPPLLEWKLPAGFAAGDIEWPYPDFIPVPPLATYGYEREVLLPIRMTAPADLVPGTTVTLAGHVDYVVCEEECIPAEAELKLTLPVRAGELQTNTRWQHAFSLARSRLPVSADGWQAGASASVGGYRLALQPPAGVSLQGARFFVDEGGVLDHAAHQPLAQEGDDYVLALQRSEFASTQAERLSGVLVAGGRAYELSVPVRAPPAAAAAALPAQTTFLLALGLAFLGGILLNLMPCVFPVLSLKVLGFVQDGGGDPRRARLHGVSFVAGLIATFWVVAGLLLVLRAAGNSLGWGFQLQSPLFVAFMALLFFVLALSLLGVFEIGLSLTRLGRFDAHAQSYSGSFFTGVLATVVATPCTAPFMGSALGVALSLSAPRALAIFTFLGLGMALPYLILALRPSLLRFLPRPGPWMISFRQFLAFPLLATVIWLLWVFGLQTGVDGLTWLLGALLAVAAAILLLKSSRRVAQVAAAVFVLAAATATWQGAAHLPPPTDTSTTTSAGLVWEKFSPARVEQLRAQGRAVFIDFTAAWCITCQVNKRVTFQAEAVQQAFREKNVALLVADWTRHDATITDTLRSFGRSGVPLYVLYDGARDPVLLPEVLTAGIMLDALDSLTSAVGQRHSDTDIKPERVNP
jgi:thiol:disulfide interchange protein